MNRLEEVVSNWPVTGLPATLAVRTRKVYDRLAAVYPMSTMLFHSRAHRRALGVSRLADGMRVLEVATGSGEMFRRIVRANAGGTTVGIDLSPNMASRTQRAARRRFPACRTHCQAVDARHMPFRSETFDAVFCCYLLELLSADDIVSTLGEFRRVLRDRGHLTLVLIGQNTAMFNSVYRVLGRVAPAFWGRQVEQRVPQLIESVRFEIVEDHLVRQTFYPSRVLVARK
ncbi:MAG TPA: class I SAM-dependent methyltransferase [Candidatus Acidoferrales bacterium]|nr:class I SAM-dependent methyltransferase [Candidatus Acidoferrales bacterium]